MTKGSDEELLARNMIDVHGAEAVTIARGNARGAALARQPAQAKFHIRVLGIIQRQQASKSSRSKSPRMPLPALSEAESAKG